MNLINIAIDGPSASGKSTIAKLLADRLGFTYVDTGAMYRCLALKAHDQHVNPDDEQALTELLTHTDIRLEQERVIMDGQDVSNLIRDHLISTLASKVSRHPAVRQEMVRRQQALVRSGGYVMDGRDIGSVVIPDAAVKFFQVADPKERALRRWRELKQKQPDLSFEQVYQDILKRDEQDIMRQASPLKCVPDAISIDTTNRTIESVLDEMIHIINSKTGTNRKELKHD